MLKHFRAVLLAVGVACCLAAGAVCAEEADVKARAEEILASMTIEQKIGQTLLVNFRTWKAPGQEKASDMVTLNDEIRDIIKTYHIGNIILFGENTRTTEGCARLTAELQSCALAAGDIPLLIGVDQEGGIVTRLGQGTCLPGNMALGAGGDTSYAYLAGRVIGSELASLGVNCDFAPDSDVNDNPLNPVIGLRSFGSNAENVAAMAGSYLNGLESGGVIGCAKHFPGHGNTDTDTHTGLAIVNKTKDEWNGVEAVPFKALIDSGIGMIMSAHIQYPNLDSTQVVSKSSGKNIYLPATLSRAILTDLLKGELGFDGVICTDAMDMQAITDNFGETQAAIMAIKAGADMLCNPTEMTCQEDAAKLKALYAAIIEAVKTGELPEERLDDAARRVLILKLKNGVIGADYLSPDEQAAKALKTVGCAEHRLVEREIAESAITLYGNETIASVSEGEKILFAVPYDNEANSVRFALNRLAKEGSLPSINIKIYDYEKAEAVSDELKGLIKKADRVVIISEMHGSTVNDPTNWLNVIPKAILAYANKLGKANAAIISAGLPYDAKNYAGTNVYLCYGYVGMTENDAKSGTITGKYGPNIPAAVAAALGALEPKGTLPVELG